MPCRHVGDTDIDVADCNPQSAGGLAGLIFWPGWLRGRVGYLVLAIFVYSCKFVKILLSLPV